MEKKLAEFRARRQGEHVVKGDQGPGTQPRATHTTSEPEETRAFNQISQSEDRSDWLLDSAVGRWLASRQFVISNVTLLKVLLWLVLLGLFVELEFGLPFFVISLFYWLYEGLRSPAPREPGELSAYSVFNPNCQPLLGTLTAEQLEGEMGYKPLASR
ncbi:SAYSvFN domain-containing protein 1 isoform X2 [Mastacembelus armatus]|uniref:SAYSvFN domain-containing protein 1 isoform X2 n=1 Tax=Mastacembelus armatus TaxID=205130 RepID=UPI000E45CA7D|nr:SAYSvFN domain-containing protein 1 isoform X2 [Mastacembelus armatus]